MAANNNKNKQEERQNLGKVPGGAGGNVPRPKFNPYWFYGIIAVLFLVVNYFFTGNKGPVETNWNKVRTTMLADRDVERIVVVNNEKALLYLKKNSEAKYKEDLEGTFVKPAEGGPHFFWTIGSVETFEQKLMEAQEGFPPSDRIEAEYRNERNWLNEILWSLGPFVLLILLWWWIFRRMSKGAGGGPGGIFSVGKSQARIFDRDARVNTSFKDVAGLSEAKQEVEEIVEFLKNPEKFTKLGGKIPKGALLVGPPGTGKTLLAKAVAGEANVPFFSMSGSDFVEMFVGVGASRVRDLFKQAKEKAPCIVFIDEIDAIGRARGRNPNFGSNDERENTLNQLLTEMDGFDTNSGVIVLAATNRADILDRALMRAGRFDRQINVELPDLNERGEIFLVHLKPLKLHEDVKVEFLAKQTPGFSGADIANVCNEAALIAARKNHESVTRQDFLDAIDRIVGGLEKKNKIISVDEKKTIAYHEAGHATISWLLPYAHPLVKVTIVPRGKALGAAWYLPEERSITTREQLLDEMCSALGGRAAEEIVFGKISSGAQNDLERITKQAYAMVSIFGMSEKIGTVSFYDSSGQSDYSFTKPYSEKTAQLIDEEAKAIIDQEYKRACSILRENQEGHQKLAELLLEREVIFSEDMEQIFGKRAWDKHGEMQSQENPPAEEKPEDDKIASAE
ncbi:MAG TPA: ATP-dependent zinc metalloprotease FtsH [Prolixibacteraceae bacterium]|jgi:cell division protease FtsH|nr:ATP-dependent zinc metalloprotease FtsH [Prolixibacteraceae bacterium]OQB81925.1 MAG: ATP-dependent zinc metalloprotease FtsH [Bacteroidetes bacterium ADurb.Bin123]HNZ69655.1 ATP-dependent zinc metalloprotease FtsH [Prolixibacteraceae bacterium]HOC87253.1 ATP-dependent zinc metalloprotease FtsH [Prolixibacteraceae bacterium]HOF56315.1 ATP-dependent zinc metalloprotease FtsH [Prolixibacteraceae bacterium]